MAQLLYRPLAHALSAVRQLSSALAQYMVMSWSMRLQYTKEEQAAEVDRLQPHVSSTMPGASNIGTTPSLRGLRIEFAYQCGPHGLNMRGQLGVDL